MFFPYSWKRKQFFSQCRPDVRVYLTVTFSRLFSFALKNLLLQLRMLLLVLLLLCGFVEIQMLLLLLMLRLLIHFFSFWCCMNEFLSILRFFAMMRLLYLKYFQLKCWKLSRLCNWWCMTCKKLSLWSFLSRFSKYEQ